MGRTKMLAEVPLLDKEGVRGWLIRVLDSVPTTPCPSSAEEGS
jgi:hypothetical protein